MKLTAAAATIMIVMMRNDEKHDETTVTLNAAGPDMPLCRLHSQLANAIRDGHVGASYRSAMFPDSELLTMRFQLYICL